MKRDKLVKVLAVSIGMFCLPCMGTDSIGKYLPNAPIYVSAVETSEEVTLNGVTYVVYSDYAEVKSGKWGVAGNTSAIGDCIIQSTVNGKPVTKIGEFAFDNNKSITSLKIPDSVTNIGGYAFRACTELKSVNLPDSIVSIGESAFWACKGLTEIVIPNALTTISSGTFKECVGLNSIIIPINVKNIGNSAFEGCSSLIDIVMLGNIDAIGDSTFSNCTNLKNISMKGDVLSIGKNTFSDCTTLKDIKLPSTVKSIGNFAFSNCVSLIDFTLPEDLTTVGTTLFKGCSNLKVLTVLGDLSKLSTTGFADLYELLDIMVIPNTYRGNTKPGQVPYTLTKTVVLYDKDNTILQYQYVRPNIDYRIYLNKIGTEWSMVSGTGSPSNITDNLEFKLTGELIGGITEKLENPLLVTLKDNLFNRENTLINLR